MSAPNTTPNPWKVAAGCDQYISADGVWVASTMGTRGETGAANAHQIAASGDLYDALEALCAGDIDVSGTAIILANDARQKLENGFRALRKARGEAS